MFSFLLVALARVLERRHVYIHAYNSSHQDQTCAGPWGSENQKEYMTCPLKSDFEYPEAPSL